MVSIITEVAAILNEELPMCLQYIGDTRKLAEYLERYPEDLSKIPSNYLRQGIENANEAQTFMFMTFLHKKTENKILVESLNILKEKQGVHHSEFPLFLKGCIKKWLERVKI